VEKDHHEFSVRTEESAEAVELTFPCISSKMVHIMMFIDLTTTRYTVNVILVYGLVSIVVSLSKTVPMKLIFACTWEKLVIDAHAVLVVFLYPVSNTSFVCVTAQPWRFLCRKRNYQQPLL